MFTIILGSAVEIVGHLNNNLWKMVHFTGYHSIQRKEDHIHSDIVGGCANAIILVTT